MKGMWCLSREADEVVHTALQCRDLEASACPPTLDSDVLNSMGGWQRLLEPCMRLVASSTGKNWSRTVLKLGLGSPKPPYDACLIRKTSDKLRLLLLPFYCQVFVPLRL